MFFGDLQVTYRWLIRADWQAKVANCNVEMQLIRFVRANQESNVEGFKVQTTSWKTLKHFAEMRGKAQSLITVSINDPFFGVIKIVYSECNAVMVAQVEFV